MNKMMSDISITDMHAMLKDFMNDLQAKAANVAVPGIPTGFQPLDNLIGGFKKGKVYVIGGRPYMGKEEFMLSMIIDIIMESRLSVLMFSTSHLKPDYIQRLMTIYCDIPVMHLVSGQLDVYEWERLDKGATAWKNAPLFMHDTLDLPLDELMETARNVIKERGVKIIFIDCLQMIDFAKGDDNPSERIAKVMLSLKQLAHQTEVPIVVGSMLNRGVEYREGIEGKQPQLMDLANSSYIEGFADVVMLVHRPDYYHIYQDDYGRDLRRKIKIVVKKNGFKPSGSIFLEYHQDTGVVAVVKNTNKAVEKLIKTFDLEEY